MHCNRRDFVVWMSDLCSKCLLIEFHKIQTKEIKCRQFSPSPCLFAEPEAVSKHSVSLWIGYSGITSHYFSIDLRFDCIFNGHFSKVIAVHIQYTSISNVLQSFHRQSQPNYAI